MSHKCFCTQLPLYGYFVKKSVRGPLAQRQVSPQLTTAAAAAAGEVMLGDLSRAGFDITTDHEAADAIVVNTCAFVEVGVWRRRGVGLLLSTEHNQGSRTSTTEKYRCTAVELCVITATWSGGYVISPHTPSAFVCMCVYCRTPSLNHLR